MRKVKRDDGAVAVVVALSATALFGFAAIVVDAGSLYAERRQLQAGADAAVLAAASACVESACGYNDMSPVADAYADSNTDDRRAASVLCGNANGTWIAACEQPADLPRGVKYARVTTSTLNLDGTTVLPPLLARALIREYPGKQVSATAVAVWGSRKREGSTVPLIISACEWKKHTVDGTVYAPDPSYTSDGTPYYDGPPGANPYPIALEAEIVTLGGSSTSTCRTGGGFDEEIPGGFGWLRTDKNCEAQIEDGEDGPVVDSKPGMNPCVKTLLPTLVDTVVSIPVFATPPDHKTYDISGWASFYVTGFAVGGSGDRFRMHVPPWDSPPLCFSSASDDCITGYFLSSPPEVGVVGGASFGENVVQLYE